ncbi:MAG: hypothetical protein KBT29_09220 [Prevotellaceae bacterium]|nr:hypothetical protein [Candidatus Minthosoma caballi]
MKRLMHIFMSVTLSMMIILMGSGLVTVHCNHTGTTKVVTFGQSVCAKKCKTTSSCMDVKVIKLSTMNQASSSTLEFKTPVVALPWLMKPLYELKEIILPQTDVASICASPRYGPPRQYLNLICVLLI